jgi:colanic acid/amylovoran biosynthesis glycosyltransferase
MKIAFIVSQFPTLSESFIVQQIVGLMELGHEVRIFSFAKSDQTEIQKEVTELGLIEKTTYISLPRKKWQLRLKGLQVLIACLGCYPKAAGRLLLSFISASGFSYHDTFLTYLFLRERCDAVYAHFGPNGVRSLCLKKARPDIRHITAFHGYDVTVYIRQNGKECYRELFRQGDRFTYNSEATKQKLLSLGCPEDKMKKLPMGIDVGKMPYKERVLVPSQKIRLLSVGRLVEMKGREYAIKAVARLVHRYPIQYDIVGDGPLRQELQGLIDELIVGDSIKVWGWVGSERLEELYQQAHLFIHPSVTSSDGNQEGQGVVLLEAQAYGIPVIATRHGAFPDSVVEGRTGFLVPERDVDRLSKTIEELIQTSEVWPQMGRDGRTFVEEHFDAQKLNRKLDSICRL